MGVVHTPKNINTHHQTQLSPKPSEKKNGVAATILTNGNEILMFGHVLAMHENHKITESREQKKTINVKQPYIHNI